MVLRGWVACLLLLAAILSGWSGAAQAKEEQPCMFLVSSQKQRPGGDLPHIRALINGKPVLMTLDTGFSSLGALSENSAARLGLTPVPSGQVPHRDFTGVAIGEQILGVRQLAIEGLTVRDTEMLLVPTKELYEDGTRMDGKLGSVLLALLDIHFDKGHGFVDLIKNSCPLDRLDMPDGILRLRLIDRDFSYLVPARVGSAKGLALIDTGSTLSVLFSDCAGDLLAGRRPVASIDAIAFSGKRQKVDLYKLDRITLDDKLAVTGPTFMVADRPPFQDKSVCFLLGMSFFRTPVIKSMTISPSTSSLFVQVK